MSQQKQNYYEKREKLKKENPNKFYAYTSDFDKLNKILNNAEDKIENYYKTLVYLDPQNFKLLEYIINEGFNEEGAPITISFKKDKKK